MEDSKRLSIVKSNSGHDILLIDQVEMHSKFNPIQEAYDLALSLSDKLKSNPNILVLGLALGYHIQQLDFKMREYHKNPNIFIVEPNEEVVHLAQKSHIIPNNHITIFSGRDIEKYYQHALFVEFLNQKPLIVPHKPTINLEADFFKRFLAYKASNKINKIMPILNKELQEVFRHFPQHYTLANCLDEIYQQEELGRVDMQLLAFRELYNQFAQQGVAHE